MLLLLIWLAFEDWAGPGGLSTLFEDTFTLAAAFGIVVLHELGHAAVARRFGINTRRILLSPIGGIAALERMPERPIQEILVALAGPAVNIVLAAALFGALAIEATLVPSYSIERPEVFFGLRLLLINLAMAIFNLVPAFPMDGGRILRALLALRFPRLRATEIAAGVGLFLALLMGIVGLALSPVLVLAGLFVAAAGREEVFDLRLRELAGGHRVRDVAVTNLLFATLEQPVGPIAQELMERDQAYVPVLDGERLVGVARTKDLVLAARDAGVARTVAEFVDPNTRTVPGELPLSEALVGIYEAKVPPVVVEAEHPVGLIFPDQIFERLSLEAEAQSSKGQRLGPV